MAIGRRGIVGVGSILVVTVFLGGLGRAEALDGAALVMALRQGGFVLVMRHASSPAKPPDKAAADPANLGYERQLDDFGRNSAREMGAALKRLRIPVGMVWSSPAYRTRETIRLASLGVPQIAPELDEGTKGMQGGADASKAAWLRAKAAEAPKTGTNTIIVTHFPNIVGAFGQRAASLAAGEALVFHPGGKAADDLVARVKIQEWSRLGKQS